MVPKFRQYNVTVHCAIQTKQLELCYWQLLYVTGMWGLMWALPKLTIPLCFAN